MKHKHCSFALAAVVISMLSQSALAQDSGPEFKFSGFGTLGLVSTDNDNAEFRTGLRQNRGAKKTADFGVDSRLGLQVNAKFNNTFSGVAQVMASRIDGKDTPRVEWLFGQAAVTPWLDVRLGRVVMPAFMVSDSLNVGYASHWVRPPVEAYGLYPASSFDGGQLVLRTQWGNTNVSAQVSAGQSESNVYPGGLDMKAKMPKLTAVNLMLENGNWSVRLGQVRGTDSELINPMIPPQIDDVFTGIGGQYDDGKLLVMAEYLTRRSDKGIGTNGAADSDTSYLSAGYRFGPWMPYLTLSEFKPKLPQGYALTQSNRRTTAIGVRWDAYKNVAIKAQYESTDPSVQFVKAVPSLAALPKVKVFSLAVDFVF